MTGLPPGVLATVLVSGDPLHPNCMAVNGLNLYWADVSGELKIAPLAGLPPSAAPVTIRTISRSTHGIAVDADYLYWGDFPNGTILRVPLATPNDSPTALIIGQEQPNALFVDDTYIYWGNFAGGEIRRTRK